MSNPFYVPLETSVEVIYQQQLDAVRAVVPDFEPAGITEQMLRARAQLDADANENLAARMKAEIVESQGDTLGIPVQDGTPATSTVTVQALDTIGHTIPEGTPVVVGASSGDAIPCETTAEGVIAAADDEVTVPIAATETGAQLNGADGPARIDLDWIDTTVLDDPLDGGTDDELPEDYEVRLAEETQLRAEVVALPADGAVVARRHPAVVYAYTADHWNADTSTDDNELTYTVVVAGPDAADVAGDDLTETQALLAARTGTNYSVFAVNASDVTLNVTADFIAEDGFDDATAEANGDAALELATSRAQWLTPKYTNQPDYVPPTRIYATDLVAALKGAAGVLHVKELLLNGGVEYVEMPSPVHAPQTGTVATTAVAP